MATKKTEKKSPKTETTTAPAAEKDEKVLKVNRAEAAKLLRDMGFKDTHKYSNELLQRRLNKMDQYVANYDGTLDGNTKEMVDKIIAAKGNIKVTGDEPKGSRKEAPEGGKKADGKPAKKGGEKKVKTPRGEGVIATIFNLISAKALTKEQILEKLTAQFPDRQPEAMAKTIQAQLPKRMAKERKVKIEKDDKGQYSVVSK